jgi:hypothetical protein
MLPQTKLKLINGFVMLPMIALIAFIPATPQKGHRHDLIINW